MAKRDPVKKNMDLLQKPRTFRDRKKENKKNPPKDLEMPHPKHPPYKRTEDWFDMEEDVLFSTSYNMFDPEEDYDEDE